MNRARLTFLDASAVAVDLMGAPEVESKWDEPSALAQWSVRGLAGHLVRCTAGVESYLDADPAPTGTPVSPAAYYAGAIDSNDLDADEHRGIRERGEQMAAAGYHALRAEHEASLARLRQRLDAEPEIRTVRVWRDFVLLLDDYLVTRIVELTCHIDDLAVSVGVPTPQLPLEATDTSIRALTAIARHRHGDLAVIRAMARRERDNLDALHVF
jgi:hypothetical protein